MVEYIVRTDKPERLDELLHLHEIPHYEVTRLRTHGRLIDADKLKKDNPMHMQADVPYVTEVTVEEIIDDAPTVLEASTGPITGFIGDGTEASE